MSLREPCEHGRYEDHAFWVRLAGSTLCPGGRILTDAEALRTLLPGVDVETLRNALAEFDAPTLNDVHEWAVRRVSIVARAVLDALGVTDEV